MNIKKKKSRPGPFESIRRIEPDVQLTALPRAWHYPVSEMDGEFPNVEYLGCSILAKTTASGLGSIQRALKERYIDYRKNSKSKRQGQPVNLRVSRDGLTVIFPMSRPGEANQMFYDFPSINFFEAVRFVASKDGDKKFSSAFLPVEPHRLPMSGSERLFSPLEKKYHGLLKLQHPAMLACVMRRTQGIKALECHYFVTETDNDALAIVDRMETMIESGLPPRMNTDRDGNYGSRYGPDDRHARQPEPDILRRGQDERGNEYRGERFSDGWDEARMRREEENRDRYPNMGQGHSYIRQQDFYGGPPPDDIRYEGRGPDMDLNPPYAPQKRYVPDDEPKPYRHERQSSGSSGGGRYGDGRAYIHERQRSGEGRGMHDRQNSDDRSYLDNGRPSREPERFARPGGREDIPRNRVLSPGRQGYRDAPPAAAPKPYGGTPGGPLKSPRAGLPRQQFEPEPVASMSNIESRQDSESKSKPVAKVPPHLVAGVKVLPTNFANVLPKKIEAEPSRFGEEDSPYDNAQSRREFYAKKNPKYDSLEAHEDFKDLRGQGYEGRKSDSTEYRRVEKGFSPPDIVPRLERGTSWEEYEKNRVKYGEENHHDELLRKSNQDKRPYIGNRHSEPISETSQQPWSYDGEFRKFNKAYSEDRADYNKYRDEPTEELSNMFNKIGPHRVGDVGAAHERPDFQESLGYLP